MNKCEGKTKCLYFYLFVFVDLFQLSAHDLVCMYDIYGICMYNITIYYIMTMY